jgi:hypothetical protein
LADALTFGLAYAAYLLLGAAVALVAWGRPRRVVLTAAAAVALVHVGLVWGWRFGWSLDYALEKSLPGFVLFHAALGLIVAAALARGPAAGWLACLAFPVVTAGAVGAAFKYDDVSGYRIPLLAALSATALAGVLGVRARRKGD